MPAVLVEETNDRTGWLRLLSSDFRQQWTRSPGRMIAFLADAPINKATRLPSVAHSSKKPHLSLLKSAIPQEDRNALHGSRCILDASRLRQLHLRI
jgi:hypothetical protein